MNDDFYKYAYDIVVNLGRTFYRTREEVDFIEKVLKFKEAGIYFTVLLYGVEQAPWRVEQDL